MLKVESSAHTNVALSMRHNVTIVKNWLTVLKNHIYILMRDKKVAHVKDIKVISKCDITSQQ